MMITELLPQPYDEFRSVVAAIKAGESTAEFIGAGVESTVWRATLDGADYAVKLPKELSGRGWQRDIVKANQEKILTGLRGRGVGGLEQLQTGSVKDAVAIYTYEQGRNVSDMTETDVKTITRRHLAALWETVAAATDVGIRFDGANQGGSNAFFTPENGFTLIDYESAEFACFDCNRTMVILSLGSIGTRMLARLGEAPLQHR